MSSEHPMCYAMHNSDIIPTPEDLPCGVPTSTHPYVTCCVNGDTCLSDSLCKNPDGEYYNADCTDPEMWHPACGETRCGTRGYSNLKYNESSGFWACCWTGEHGIDCENPSDELYPAPPPSSLTTIQSLPVTGSGPLTYLTTSTSVPAATSTSTTTIATNTSSNSKQPSSQGVGAGAAAGIGVGVGIGVIIIGAIAAFFFFRRRTNKSGYNGGQPAGAGTASHMEKDVRYQQAQLQELDNSPARPAELDIR